MNRFAGVQHEAKSNDCYAYDNNTLHFRIRTGKNDFEQVKLILSDPYFYPKNLETDKYEPVIETVTMKKECSTNTHDHWFAEINLSRQRAIYSFELKKNKTRYLYTRKNVEKLISKSRYIDYVSSFYKFPHILSEDIFSAPEWAKDTVWYQIFPDRFAKSDHPSLIKGDICGWDEEVRNDDSQLFGGDLAGVIEKLDYIKSLGVTGIYLTPIFTAPKCHKYATTDYFKIDPAFGNEIILKELIEKARALGIRIMLDFVVNHCGDTHPFFVDAYQKGIESAYYDCFYFKENGREYKGFADLGIMPKWNTGNPLARRHLLDAAEYWAKKGISGFRLDVANEVSHDFWREFRKTVKAINPEIFIVGEVWESARPWLLGDQWDSAMHYELAGIIHEYLRGNIGGGKLSEMISFQLASYPKNVAESLLTLLSTHDTSRILTYANGNKDLVMQAFTLLFTLPGSPCIFYGEELGCLEGRGMDLTRQCMEWDAEKHDRKLQIFVSRLIELRKDNPAMRAVDIAWVHTARDYIIYEKFTPDNKLIIILNCISEENTIDISGFFKTNKAADLISGAELNFDKPILFEPFGIRILKIY